MEEDENGLNMESCNNNEDSLRSTKLLNGNKKKKKKKEPGIIYLSIIPPFMTVKKIREIYSQFGEIGRIFLQPERKGTKKHGRHFTEGWIEFKDKRLAKKIALSLNNTPMGGKRKNKYSDFLWNIKYLHRFKWIHLSERLAYEKAVHEQRMRTEISQVKRETNYFAQSVEKSENLKKLEEKVKKKGGEWKYESRDFHQISTKEEMKEKSQTNGQLEFLGKLNIFTS